MKRAAIAQRLAFILFSVALTSIAFAAPPEHAQGEPPPFNVEDCTFDRGRTMCIVQTEGEEYFDGYLNREIEGSTCEVNGISGTLMQKFEVYRIGSVPMLVVYRGASHIIESETPIQSFVTTDSELDPVSRKVWVKDYCQVLWG